MRFLSSLCFTQASVYQTSRLAYASSQFAVAEYERINAPHRLERRLHSLTPLTPLVSNLPTHRSWSSIKPIGLDAPATE